MTYDQGGIEGPMMLVDGGQSIKVGHTFFRGETTVFHPYRKDIGEPDFLARHVFRGWTRENSQSKAGERICVIGGGLAPVLLRAGTSHGLVSAGAPDVCAGGIADAHALLGALQEAEAGADLRAGLHTADLFVVCLDQAERLENGVLAIASHAETVADLKAAYAILRRLRPQAQIVFAVSPLPPAWTMRSYAPQPALTAGKATLRSAVDELLLSVSDADKNFFYFPAYELLTVPFGFAFEMDRRTLRPHATRILEVSFARYFATGVDDAALGGAHLQARADDIAAGESMRLGTAQPAPRSDATIPPGAIAWPDETALNADTSLSRTILAGLTPSERFVTADSTLIAFGSCFAHNISRYLNMIGYNVATKRDTVAYVSTMGDGIVNTDALRKQFEWAWEGKVPQAETWFDSKARGFDHDERIRQRTRELFDLGDVFIVTLGLSEVWYDEPTGEIFWRAVPTDKYDPARHKFRMIGQAESLENLRSIYRLIRKYRPEARVVFTVSPIPLTATFRGAATMVASAVSKAILRSAVDEFYREASENDPSLFYFPAYEVITHLHEPFGDDLRHPYVHGVGLAMKLFERHFCDTALDDEGIASVLADVRVRDLALNSEGRESEMEEIKKEKSVWSNEDAHRIEAIARMRARDDIIASRAAEKEKVVAAREAERTAKREAAIAARAAATEERRNATAEERRKARLAPTRAD